MKPLKPLAASKAKALKPLIAAPSTLPEETGHPENDSRADHIAMMRQLRKNQERANAEANDANFWVGVYFQNEAQKKEFIAALNLKTAGQFIDGLDLAEKLGIDLTPRAGKYKTGTLDKKCAELAR